MGELKRYALIENCSRKKVEVITCRVADQNNLHQAAPESGHQAVDRRPPSRCENGYRWTANQFWYTAVG